MTMATYMITSPNGEEFEITAPDDATEEQVLNYAKTQFESMAKSGESVPKPAASSMPTEPLSEVQTAADPEAAMMQAVETGKTDYAGEIGQQLGLTARAGIKGLGALPAMFGDALNTAVNLMLPEDKQLPMVSDTIGKLADAVAVPRNEQERVIGAAAETVASVISAGGIKAGVDWLVSKGINQNVATKVAQEMGNKLGQQATAGSATAATAQQVTESTDNAGIGLAAGLAVGLLAGKNPKVASKTAQTVKQEASALYEQAKAANLRLKPVAGKLLDSRIVTALNDDTLPLKGEGMGTVRETLRTFRASFGNKDGVSLEQVDKLRQDAANLIKNAGGNENQRAAGYVIRNAVDEFLSTVSTPMIKSGDKEGIKLLVQGRKTFRTASRAGVLEDVLSRAKYLSEIDTNLDYSKAVQREITKLMKKEKLLKANFTPAEIDRLKSLSKGGKGLESFIKLVGGTVGLAGKTAAFVGAQSTGGLSLVGYGAGKGVEAGAKSVAASARSRGIQNEVNRILGGLPEPEMNQSIVGSMFGLQNISP